LWLGACQRIHSGAGISEIRSPRRHAALCYNQVLLGK
jgi:hypothetical protein